ncbi:MAG: HEAT repeat domain-containing protein [Thioalkalispiraceae bacterium]|jgi:HEAT repeat protein
MSFYRPHRFTCLSLVLLSVGLSACAIHPQGPTSREIPSESPAADLDEGLASQINALKTTRQVKDKIMRLHHQDPVERAWAAYQLAKLGRGAAPAVPYLIRLLNDATPVLLSRYLGGGFHSSSDTTPALEASRTLAKIGDPAIKALTRAMLSDEEEVRRLAVKALGQIGDIQSIDSLIKALSDPSRRVQATAAIALGSYRHPVASQRLTEEFTRVSPGVRIHLVYALSQINDIIAVPFLIKQFAEQTPDVKASIALAFGKLRDARALSTLVSAVGDNDEIVRANAFYALSSFYTPKVIDVLIGGLDDPVQRVREAASEALTEVTGMKLGTDKQKWLSWWGMQKKAMNQQTEAEK